MGLGGPSIHWFLPLPSGISLVWVNPPEREDLEDWMHGLLLGTSRGFGQSCSLIPGLFSVRNAPDPPFQKLDLL